MANHTNAPRPRYTTVTPKGEFKKLSEAAEAEGVTPMAIVKKLDNRSNASYYRKYPDGVISMGKKTNRKYSLDRTTLVGTVVMTPSGKFSTAKEAAEALGVSPCTVTSRIKNPNFPGFYRIQESELDAKEAQTQVAMA